MVSTLKGAIKKQSAPPLLYQSAVLKVNRARVALFLRAFAFGPRLTVCTARFPVHEKWLQVHRQKFPRQLKAEKGGWGLHGDPRRDQWHIQVRCF